MKKEYGKPMIMFESFKMASSIAGNCETKTGSPAQDSCGYDVDVGYGIIKLFINGVEDCKMTTGDDGAYGVCYHVPTGDNLFNS